METGPVGGGRRGRRTVKGSEAIKADFQSSVIKRLNKEKMILICMLENQQRKGWRGNKRSKLQAGNVNIMKTEMKKI